MAGSEARTPFVRCNEKTTGSAITPKITITECERNCPFSARSEIISHSRSRVRDYSHRQITRPVLRQISSKPTRMADLMHPKKKSPWFRARRVWFCTCFVAVIMSNYRAKLGRPRQYNSFNRIASTLFVCFNKSLQLVCFNDKYVCDYYRRSAPNGTPSHSRRPSIRSPGCDSHILALLGKEESASPSLP